MGDADENQIIGIRRFVVPLQQEDVIYVPLMFPINEHPNEGGGDEAPNESAAPIIDDAVDSVSMMYKCQTSNARKLALYDLFVKFKDADTYDIGGTYSGKEQDLWFYYTTSVCPGPVCLLNLFVYHRKAGSLAIGISNTNEITYRKRTNDMSTKQGVLSKTLTWYHLKSGESNQNHHIKTFRFTDKDVKSLENVSIYVPISIKLSETATLDDTILKKIKLSHDFRGLLAQKEKSDFVLESLERKQFPTHKIILAAHSPVLREIIRSSDTNSTVIELNNKDMELLIEFIYTGTIKNIANQDCLNLLTIADKFQLKNLFTLTQFAISSQINVNNAVEVAVLSEKYNLEELQTSVFEFIRKNQSVLETEGWHNLSDLKLTKKLFQYIHKHSDLE